jgi:hypothetical protein
MRKAIPFCLLSAMLFFQPAAWADPPMVSANGFSCVKSQFLVTCQGQFPDLPGVLSASGTYGVQITYDTQGPPKFRYLFDSTTGCLMKITLNATGEATQVLVKNSGGTSQSFFLPNQRAQAFGFCKS